MMSTIFETEANTICKADEMDEKLHGHQFYGYQQRITKTGSLNETSSHEDDLVEHQNKTPHDTVLSKTTLFSNEAVDLNMNSIHKAVNIKSSLILPSVLGKSNYEDDKRNENDSNKGWLDYNRNETSINKRDSSQSELEKKSEGNFPVIPINSFKLHEELKRSLMDAKRLKEDNCQKSKRKLELEAEIIEASKIISCYEARSDTNAKHEMQLRNDLNAIVRRAKQAEREMEKCKRKIILMEKLYVESEKRNSEIEKKAMTERENAQIAAEKVSSLLKNIEELKAENSRLNEAIDDKEKKLRSLENHSNELENEIKQHKNKLCSLTSKLQESNKEIRPENMMKLETENMEYKRILDALKLQYNEMKILNENNIEEIKQQKVVIENLSMQKTMAEESLKQLQLSEKQRREEKFLQHQQCREVQVQLENFKRQFRNQQNEKEAVIANNRFLKQEINKLQREMKIREDMIKKSSTEHVEDRRLKEDKQLNNDDTDISSRKQEKQEDTDLMKEQVSILQEEEKFKSLQSKAYKLEKDNENLRNKISQAGHEQEQRNVKVNEQRISRSENEFRSKIKELEDENKSLRKEQEKTKANEETNARDFNTLREQHDKISIEMALTRNVVMKLETDNNDLRQEISQLKTDIALGADASHSEGGIIPGKYRRGNFEIPSDKEWEAKNVAKQKERTQSMTSAFTFIKVKEKDSGKQKSGFSKTRSMDDLIKAENQQKPANYNMQQIHYSVGSDIFNSHKRNKMKEASPNMPVRVSSFESTSELSREPSKPDASQSRAYSIERCMTANKTNPFLNTSLEEEHFTYSKSNHVPLDSNITFGTSRSVESSSEISKDIVTPVSNSTAIGRNHNEEQIINLEDLTNSTNDFSAIHGFQMQGAFRSSPAVKTFASLMSSESRTTKSRVSYTQNIAHIEAKEESNEEKMGRSSANQDEFTRKALKVTNMNNDYDSSLNRKDEFEDNHEDILHAPLIDEKSLSGEETFETIDSLNDKYHNNDWLQHQ